jgi:hypothetical protein
MGAVCLDAGRSMLRFLKYWLWDIDEAPDRIGPIGFGIMGAFLLFCAVVLYFHDIRHP